MSDLIKKLDYKVDRTLGNKIAVVMVSMLSVICLISMLWGIGVTSSVTPVEVTNSDWTIVPIEGYDVEFEIVPQGGVKPHYTVMVNADPNRIAHFPGSSGINLGNGATNLWFTLDGNDSFKKAIVLIKRK